MNGFSPHHEILLTFAACWLISCLAETMPKPNGTSGKAYLWAFQFLHVLAGAIPRLVALTFPAKYAQIFNTTLQEQPAAPVDEKKSAS